MSVTYQLAVDLGHPLDGLYINGVLDVVVCAIWVSSEYRLVEDPFFHRAEAHVHLLTGCQGCRRDDLQILPDDLKEDSNNMNIWPRITHVIKVQVSPLQPVVKLDVVDVFRVLRKGIVLGGISHQTCVKK